MIFAQCSECQRDESFNYARTNDSHVGMKSVLFVAQPKLTNSVSSCSSSVASAALSVVSSDQCDGNLCCPGFDGSVCVVRCCVCVCIHVECVVM